MEDPSEDWSVEECSLREARNSKLKRIWDGSVWLGKRIVVAGAVVSSAPLVLPPLVALSAIGVAFSIALGFVFASYACTEKVMSSLLKEPTSPFEYHMLDHGTLYVETEEYGTDGGERLDEGVVENGYEEDYDREAEEEEFGKDEKKWIEMRIEFMDECDGDIKEAECSLKNIHGEVGHVIDDKDVIVEEDGYKEDIEESPGNLGLKSSDASVVLKGIRQAEEEISSLEEQGEELATSMARAVLVAEVGGEDDSSAELVEGLAAGVTGRAEEDYDFKGELRDIKEEVLKRETTGLIEAIRDEGKADPKKHNLELSRAETPQSTNSEYLITQLESTMSKPTDAEEAKVLADDENIMEQIQAIRTIIGYQAVPYMSFVEELKALYVFTGVEPPASAKDIKERLRFLKSVIGVK